VCKSFKLKFLGVTILRGGVEFPIFLLIFAWALQQCSANALPVIGWGTTDEQFSGVRGSNFTKLGDGVRNLFQRSDILLHFQTRAAQS